MDARKSKIFAFQFDIIYGFTDSVLVWKKTTFTVQYAKISRISIPMQAIAIIRLTIWKQTTS